jgi:3-hydroxyisobutyrate dehydrogenase
MTTNMDRTLREKETDVMMNEQSSQPTRPPVTVIGTGTMGTAMAGRLLSEGFTVAVWSRHASSTAALVGLGATAYDSPADAAHEAGVVITMLPTAEAITEVMFDRLVVQALRPGAVWAQMATVGSPATEQLAARTRLQRQDVTFIDAPVSGSRGPAEAGQLLILAAGPEQPAGSPSATVFDALGRRTLWLGATGAGSRLKLILNTWLAFQTEAAAEASALARRLDIPTSAVFAALDDNPLASPYAVAKLHRIVGQDFRSDFSLAWALKDLELVAAEAGPEVAPAAHAIAERWRLLVREGQGGLDVSAAGLGLDQDHPLNQSRSADAET